MSKSLQLLTWALPLGLLLGCASTTRTTPPSTPEETKPIFQASTPTSSSSDVPAVSASGPAADHAAIESSNQQIYKAERTASGPAQPAATPTTGIP